jgi:quinoprotein glucose dehydrogenase
MGKLRAAITLGLGLCTTGAYAQQDWPAYGGHDGTHYSTLSQINRDNVKNLVVAWKYDTGEKGGIEANPIVVGNVLYATTPGRSVVALDAATGKLIWKFNQNWNGGADARRFLLERWP